MPGSRRWPGAIGAITGTISLAATLAGCASSRAISAPISVASAVVLEVSGADIADGYLVIQNSGPADRLTGVSSSSGGVVMVRGPAGPGPSAARTVRQIAIPAHSLVRLDPTGMHLMLTHLDPRQHAALITLTLVFARAGRLRVVAEVTNPQTDNGGYFGL